MKVLIAINDSNWDGTDIGEYLNVKGHDVSYATTSTALYKLLEDGNYELAIVNQELLGLTEDEGYIHRIRDLVPTDKRVLFIISKDIDRTRDTLINQQFFDFMVGSFKADELMDILENPRTFDDVRSFQLRTVKNTYEKVGTTEVLIEQDVISTKVLPNKIVGFNGATATTTIMSVAAALSEDSDLDIVLVDFNPNAHLSLQFMYDKYLSSKCLSELVDHMRKDKLTKDNIKQFLVRHSKYKNVWLLPGFKKLEFKNFFDFPEAEDSEYIKKILYMLKRTQNVVLVDTPRQFFNGSTIDTINEVDTMYFLTTPYLPSRIDIKTATKFFYKKKQNSDFKLIISSITGTESITPKMIFKELMHLVEYEGKKQTGSYKLFDNYLEIPCVSNMTEVIENREYAYEKLDGYREAINKVARDIYYYQGGKRYGENSTRNSTKRNAGKKLSIGSFFNRRRKAK